MKNVKFRIFFDKYFCDLVSYAMVKEIGVNLVTDKAYFVEFFQFYLKKTFLFSVG